ncbi:prepilin-type N-terminal cleavage/methylation domain-containing protein [Thermoanaerobacterium sp. R66]|uniref:prepilin-type N-terminal cleavage/methylation domain-containing protein n=1 Tax=Thermoanaerobacterium sp. R66 TaxID=2742479 RepID=UPI0023808184|nr:prepilin-type N-terminal cleavage/methylation domain-containing protein [Thermoanaerobacterium sp. R66]MDE4541674.1 prepilin-type N-terminal cleavage/methylation domain-containing protein [Thermoanaerobacterium sp. R66]
MKYLKNAFGMTLIEVLVAIALFSIAAIPLLGVFHESVITNADSKIRTKEATIAQSIAEDIKAGNIKNNNDLQKKIFPEIQEGYYLSVPENPQSVGNGLMKYKFQVNYQYKTNLVYTLYVVAPASNVTAYIPPTVNIPSGSTINYRDISNIFTVFAWGALAAILFLYPIVKLNLISAFSIVFGTIVDAIDLWKIFQFPYILKDGYTLKTIADEISAKIGNINFPPALQWWDPNFDWRWLFDPTKWK